MTETTPLREDDLNRLLRRADWRFLLPHPRPTRSLCLARGGLEDAVAYISGSVVDSDDVGAGSCDLAVAVNPDASALAQAYALLQPGGALYTEWYWPWAGGVGGVRRRLQAAGFARARCYWPWPWPDRGSTQVWLPLDAPEALRFFVAAQPRAHSPLRRALNRLRRGGWNVARRTGLALPICVVAEKPLPLDEAAGTAPALRPTRLLLTYGARSVNKVVALDFADGRDRPERVVKIGRLRATAASLAREAEVLRALDEVGDSDLVMPRVLFYDDGDPPRLGETAVHGVALFTRLRPDTYRDLALRATEWLVRLARRRPTASAGGLGQGRVRPILDAFRRSYGPVVDSHLLQESEARLSSVDALPVVCEHRDFSPWNVLVTEGGDLAALDWESAEWRGLPALDAMYFLTYLAFFLDGAIQSGRYAETYRALRDPSTRTGAVTQECLDRYAAGIGVSAAALEPLWQLVWLVHSQSEYRRLAEDAGGQPAPDALRQSLFLRLWQEEMSYVGIGYDAATRVA